jgi:hypothetical protein
MPVFWTAFADPIRRREPVPREPEHPPGADTRWDSERQTAQTRRSGARHSGELKGSSDVP